MNKPIGVRLDKQTRTQLEKDAEKLGIALSTYASKILNDWTNTYKPMLDGGSILFPIPLLKIFYNFVKENDYETIANLIGEYWHDSMKTSIKNPSYEDYLTSLEFWFNISNQRLSVLGNHPPKHVINHSWGFSYSKITCIVLRKVWESLGFRFEEIELKENMFSYYLHELSQDV
jgi:hypothetical protein